MITLRKPEIPSVEQTFEYWYKQDHTFEKYLWQGETGAIKLTKQLGEGAARAAVDRAFPGGPAVPQCIH